MIISLDTEYDSLNFRTANLLSISIGMLGSELLFKPNELDKVKQITDQAKIIFVQNGVVDEHILKRNGLALNRSNIIDCMILEHLLDERLDHDLGSMSLRYFNDNYKSEFWSKYDSFQEAPSEEADTYERKDVRYTYDIGMMLLEQLSHKPKLVAHVHKLNWSLFDIETEGILIDTELLNKTNLDMSIQIESMLPKLREEFRDYCETWEIQEWTKEIEKRKSAKGRAGVGRPVFSFTSDKQVGKLLYDQDFLGLPITTKTKKGNPSTDYETLRTLAESCPKVQSLVEYKGTKAVYNTFVKGLSERIENGRVHPHFSVNGTETGRLSSSNPNFQNMPQDGVIRNFILPDPGCVIIGADYESLEVGVELNLTNDPALLRIFQDGVSKHDITAEAVGMSRKDAKTLNFLCQYGGGVWKIQKTFGVSEKQAQDIFDKYWDAYKGVMYYKKKVFKELADTGQVENCFGRIRHFNPPTNKWETEKQQRQAYSHMVQGPGAEMTNIATYEISKYLKHTGIGRLLFPVHDEIVCSIKKGFEEQGMSDIVSLMQQSNQALGFKYKIKAKAYGPYPYWRKA